MSRAFIVPRQILTGSGALEAAAPLLGSMGTHALIVTGQIVVTLPCFQSLTGLLEAQGVQYTVFTGITDEPTDRMIEAGTSAYREHGCDFLIGIGGGSPLDAMKAIAVLAACGGSITDYMGKEISGKLPPMAAIPTTAGTGSEATQFTVITDSEQGIKMLLKGQVLVPQLAVVDPALSVSAPKRITAATGLDALTHAIESYTSRKRQPLTDTVALAAVKRIFRYLPTAYSNGSDLTARSEMAIAALEAGMAINNASVTLVHGMSRPIGALFHVPHGISNAMLLEKCLDFALEGDYPGFAALARAIGAADTATPDPQAAEALIGAVRELCRVCQVPTLEEYGIDRTAFFSAMDKMAEDAIASGSPANTMKPVTKADVIRIYCGLWET